MMNKKRVIWLMAVIVLVLSGCGAKLSEEKEEFSSNSYVYQFNLPSTWVKRTEADYKAEFGTRTVFAAEDKQSKSQMFIQISSKEQLDLTDFGNATRENLKKIYGYSNLEDIYMMDYEANGNQIYKYTLNGSYKDESVWVHSYYVITDEEVLELIFYSADDNRYEDRVKIIDESVDTLVEKKQKNESKTKESDAAVTEESTELPETAVESEQMTVNVAGFRKVTVEDQEYLAVRFSILNNSEKDIKPLIWYEKTNVKQGESVLKQAEFPDSDEVGNLKVLAEDNKKTLKPGESSVGLAFYSLLPDGEQMVYVEFLESEFEQPEPIGFDLSTFD
ncbi:hypothetical protein I6N96_09385 [Enterococcus sp. BWM-S5]|uniref:DUF5067 domain-containing protein n=1 Tax=Enterococcus larvae TaxID=2794352 RepID=A0ABS4CJP2_9ENTE|nr:PsbP-related protein [Enterococcus larvae]MBP1046497.1 hypothetical protein [Enterococcus larvae]